MKYDAFISYPHKTGLRLAKKLQEALQQIAKPWNKSKALNIFRDESNLTSSPHLWSDIEAALINSRHFIIILTPDTVNSDWINDEILFWIKNKGTVNIHLTHADGNLTFKHGTNQIDWENTNCIPLLLMGIFKEIPLYTNLIPYRDVADVNIQNEDFKNEVLPLAAAIHGIAPEELAGEHIKAYQKAKLFRRLSYSFITILAGSVLFLLSYLYAKNIEITNANEKLQQTYSQLDSSTRNIRLKDSLLVRKKDSIEKQNAFINSQKIDLTISNNNLTTSNNNLTTQLGFAKKLLEGYRDDLQKRASNRIPVAKLEKGYKSNVPFAVVYYDFDKFNLRPEARQVLDDIILVMVDNPDAIIRVKGKDFYSISSEYSIQLSQRRTKSIGDYLISKGIARQRIITYGSGNTLGLATIPLQNPDKGIQMILNEINTCSEIWLEVPSQ